VSQTKAQLLDGKSATIQFTGGSASAPSVSFTGDTNTGIYSPGAELMVEAEQVFLNFTTAALVIRR
jgi:hypothetical protein